MLAISVHTKIAQNHMTLNIMPYNALGPKFHHKAFSMGYNHVSD